MDSEDEKLLEDFFTRIEASESTRVSYRIGLKHYSNFHDVGLLVLLEEAEQEMVDKIVPRLQKINNRLDDFNNEFLKPKYSDNGRAQYLAAVRSFYTHHGINTLRVVNSRKKIRIKDENKFKGFTNDEISLHLKMLTVRNQAIVLLICSSGLAKNEVRHLLRSDFEGKQDGDGVTTFELRRQKTDFDFCTFCTPEATRAISEYLSTRNDDNEFLFVTKFNTGTVRQISRQAWDTVFTRLALKLGKNTTFYQYTPTRSHNYRKWFQSTLQDAGAPMNFIDFFMAHKGENQIRNLYHRGDPEKLKEQYKKWMHLLFIHDKTFEVLKDDEIKRITENNKEQAKELQEMKSQMSAIQALLKIDDKHNI